MMKSAIKFNPVTNIRAAVLVVAIAVLPLTGATVQATPTCPTDSCSGDGGPDSLEPEK